MGLAATALLVILLLAAVSVSNLVRVVDGDGEDGEEGRCSRCYAFAVKAFPLTTVKIIVVVWQIITQVCMLLSV